MIGHFSEVAVETESVETMKDVGSKLELPDDSGDRLYKSELPDDSGEKMTPYNENGDLRSSAKYELNNYNYETDEKSRIVHTYGELRLDEADRNLNAQRKVGKEGGESGYDGGHIIASQFGGDGGIGNLIPMKSELNRAGGDYYKMEQEFKSALKEGLLVKVDVKMQYDNDSKVPSKIVAISEIDGEISKRTFDNLGG